ncbi:unnamed protein product [Polarella glacialis]|uniref:Prolyl 4-hydroxylase alpha subunit domain-containing protein n=1 Tax=Polarella glacialis TaxID=89957 RepID=A0A813JQY6_POLGL|nr:unnamed protein product [Polarella glacialis]CAE8681296.1 unnamed protein product [Polarella glacialis]
MTVAGGQEPHPRRRLRTKMAPPPGFGPTSGATSSQPSVPSSPSSADARAAKFQITERYDDYVVVKSAIEKSMLERLAEFLKRKRPRAAKMKNEGGGESDDERKARYADRDSKVCWFNAESECPWLQQRLIELVRVVGNAEWPILQVDQNGNLKCEYEDIQYAVYREKQHFQAWHQDAFAEGNDAEDARQMAVVVMLSERGAYTGGAFEAKLKASGIPGRKVIKRPRLDAGDAIVFPAKKRAAELIALMRPRKPSERELNVGAEKSSEREHLDFLPKPTFRGVILLLLRSA